MQFVLHPFYNALYNRLAADTAGKQDSYKAFCNLAQLLFPLRDNHLAFYQVPDYKHFNNKQTIDSFVASKEFWDYPMYTINTDSLKAELAKKTC